MQCQLINYLNEHDFITPDQSAYRKYHSTASCLHTSIDEWLHNIEDHYVTGVVFLYILKCFDTINYNMLLQKVYTYGVRNNELQWICS